MGLTGLKVASMSSAITELPKPEAALGPLRPDGQAVMLRGVSWDEYLAYNAEPENEGVRMYYSDGSLLLMTTGRLHERIRSILGALLHVWAEQHDQAIMCCGQWTLQKELEQKGLEADNCYYVSSTPLVRGKPELDLRKDPPPDLAMEVDITTHSRHKFDIYAALGVAEIWVWQGDSIQCFRRSGDSYELIDESVEVPDFPAEAAVSVIMQNVWEDDVTVTKEFRKRI